MVEFPLSITSVQRRDGAEVAVSVPTFEGEIVLRIRVEQGADGWVVFLPDVSGFEVLDGVLYLGTPDESPAEELARRRRELSGLDPESPEYRAALDRVSVLVGGAAVGRRDERLARRLRAAEAAGDLEAVALALNAVCARLGLSLDETEQGLTPAAHEAVERFVREALHEPTDVELGRCSHGALAGFCTHADCNRAAVEPAPTSEAAAVREALHDDPFVSDADYGRLVEEAAESDERRSWEAERDEDEGAADDEVPLVSIEDCEPGDVLDQGTFAGLEPGPVDPATTWTVRLAGGLAYTETRGALVRVHGRAADEAERFRFVNRALLDAMSEPELRALLAESGPAEVGEYAALVLRRRTRPPVGARVVLTCDVERYPHFIAPAGAAGVVVDVGDPNIYAVRLDEPLAGAEDWDNEVHWLLDTGDEPGEALRIEGES